MVFKSFFLNRAGIARLPDLFSGLFALKRCRSLLSRQWPEQRGFKGQSLESREALEALEALEPALRQQLTGENKEEAETNSLETSALLHQN